MIKINKYTYPEVNLYSPEGVFLGVLSNPVEFTDVRVQIAQNGLKGYYFIFNEERINFNEYGVFDWNQFDGFDDEMKLIAHLFRAQKALREKEKKQ